MTRTLLLATLLLGSHAALAQAPTPITVGQTERGDLTTGDEDHYAIELDANQFVAGVADQITVDVVITIRSNNDEVIGEVDVSGRGSEFFQFEVEDAGVYYISITPFEDEEGDYALTVERAEPIATEPEAVIDQIMSVVDRDDSPGVVVGVVVDGELTFAKAYGMANLTYDVPFTVDTPTNIGSTSKQFTAFAITMLADQGELGLDDDVRNYIPELPDLGETVTIRHLLTHTSGYREFLNTLAIGGRRLDLGDGIERDELVEIIQHQPELQNSPGAEWNYNNTAFGLLADIVAEVTGEPFPDWMRENVFLPLGMTNTYARSSPNTIIPGASQGYTQAENGGWQNVTDLSAAMGAGGMYTTVGDLAKWMQNYHTAELGGQNVIDQMTTSYVLTDGSETGYGFGLFLDEMDGIERIQHGGADSAHRSEFGFLPEHNSGLMILSNFAGVPSGVGAAIVRSFFADFMPQEEEAEEEHAVDQATEAPSETASDAPTFYAPDFDAFAGRYELEVAPGFILTFRRDGDQFFTQGTGQPEVEIFHREGTTFELRVIEAAVTFHRDDDGSVSSITLHQNGDHVANRLAEIGDVNYTDYEGRYFSEELEAFYTIALHEDGELVLTHRRWDDITLNHNSEDAFTGGFPVANVEFVRDDSGMITGFKAGNGRARDIWFEKVN